MLHGDERTIELGGKEKVFACLVHPSFSYLPEVLITFKTNSIMLEEFDVHMTAMRFFALCSMLVRTLADCTRAFPRNETAKRQAEFFDKYAAMDWWNDALILAPERDVVFVEPGARRYKQSTICLLLDCGGIRLPLRFRQPDAMLFWMTLLPILYALIDEYRKDDDDDDSPTKF